MPGMGFQPKNWYRIHFCNWTFLYYLKYHHKRKHEEKRQLKGDQQKLRFLKQLFLCSTYERLTICVRVKPNNQESTTIRKIHLMS